MVAYVTWAGVKKDQAHASAPGLASAPRHDGEGAPVEGRDYWRVFDDDGKYLLQPKRAGNRSDEVGEFGEGSQLELEGGAVAPTWREAVWREAPSSCLRARSFARMCRSVSTQLETAGRWRLEQH